MHFKIVEAYITVIYIYIYKNVMASSFETSSLRK
jgi:hypothetical protein